MWKGRWLTNRSQLFLAIVANGRHTVVNGNAGNAARRLITTLSEARWSMLTSSIHAESDTISIRFVQWNSRRTTVPWLMCHTWLKRTRATLAHLHTSSAHFRFRISSTLSLKPLLLSLSIPCISFIFYLFFNFFKNILLLHLISYYLFHISLFIGMFYFFITFFEMFDCCIWLFITYFIYY